MVNVTSSPQCEGQGLRDISKALLVLLQLLLPERPFGHPNTAILEHRGFYVLILNSTITPGSHPLHKTLRRLWISHEPASTQPSERNLDLGKEEVHVMPHLLSWQSPSASNIVQLRQQPEQSPPGFFSIIFPTWKCQQPASSWPAD